MNEHAPSSTPEPTPFERMAALATRALSVPKVEVDRREQQWRDDRAKALEQKNGITESKVQVL